MHLLHMYKNTGRQAKKREHPVPQKKGAWDEEEDRKLIHLVKEFGPEWSRIASFFPGRIGKQCRERYNNQLREVHIISLSSANIIYVRSILDSFVPNKRQDIKRGPWTVQEEQALIQAHKTLGNKWAEIAANIPGRTENSVKNHFNATLRKKQDKNVG